MRNQKLPGYTHVLAVGLVMGLVLAPNSALLVPALVDPAAPSAALEGFFDGLLTAQRSHYHLVGTAVAVVVDGKLALAKGYGYADLEQGSSVDAYRTIFPLASLAKLFTATAVMQLVEAGKLDLHTDINQYLGDYQVPTSFSEPITLAHLLSHTAGFEERLIGDFTCSGGQPPSLAEFVRSHHSQQVRPPGEVPAYSNEGLDLAGYIVEQVSGLPFATYVQEHIFTPLAMQQSTFALLPTMAEHRLARSYTYQAGGFVATPQDCFNHLPSGDLYSTAAEMAHFMLAYLQAGRYQEQAILQPATVQQMQQPLYRFAPQVSGNAYGFWESARNDQHILYHFGEVAEMHSVLALLPEQHIGLFAVYNSADGYAASRELLQAFLDHYYPVHRHPLPTPPANFAPELYIGSYTPLDRPFTTLDEMGYALVNAVQVQAAGPGQLRTSSTEMMTKEWSLIAPQLFHQIAGQELLAFRTDASGRATYLFFDANPATAYLRQPWYETPRFTFGLLSACGLLFLADLLLWLIYAGRRRYWATHSALRKLTKISLHSWLPRLLAVSMSLCLLLDWIGLQWLIARGDLRYGISFTLTLVITLGYIGLVLLAGVSLCMVLAWRQRYWRLFDRIHYTVVTVAGATFVWLLVHWHMLDYR